MPRDTNANVIVRLLGDVTGFTTAMKKAQLSTMTLSQKLDLVGAKAKAVGRTMTYGFTVPIVAGFALATKAAMDDEKSQDLLAKQIANVTKATDAEVASVERFINAQARLTGVADDELRPAFSKLVAATGDLGKAEELLAIAQDTAAGTGRGLDSVITAMMKGTQGQVDLFGRMGVATKDAEGKTLSFDGVLANLKDKFDGMAAEKATPFDKFKVAVGEAAESIGTILLPFVEKAAMWIAALAQKFENMSPTMRKVVVIIGLIAAALGPILMMVGTLIPLIGALVSPIGLVVLAIAALIAIFIVLYKKNETFRNAVDAAWGAIKVAIGAVVDVVRAVVRALKKAWGWVSDHKQLFVDAFNIMFAPIRTAIGLVQDLIGYLQDAWSYLKNLGSAASAGAATGGKGGKKIGGATGGIFTGPETGYPVTMHGTEAIVPLTKPADASRVLAASGLLGGDTIVNVFLDGKLIEKQVTKRQSERLRRLERAYA
jgi:hypothetical protein